MNEQQHLRIRARLRKIGPPLVVVGAILIIIAFMNFFVSIGGGFPRLLWLAIIGLPMLAVGLWMTVLGYIGNIARFYGREIGPAASATFNEIAEDAEPGLRAVGGALRGDAPGESVVVCGGCGLENEPDAVFCRGCGEAVSGPGSCPACGHALHADSRFCEACGTKTGA